MKYSCNVSLNDCFVQQPILVLIVVIKQGIPVLKSRMLLFSVNLLMLDKNNYSNLQHMSLFKANCITFIVMTSLKIKCFHIFLKKAKKHIFMNAKIVVQVVFLNKSILISPINYKIQSFS